MRTDGNVRRALSNSRELWVEHRLPLTFDDSREIERIKLDRFYNALALSDIEALRQLTYDGDLIDAPLQRFVGEARIRTVAESIWQRLRPDCKPVFFAIFPHSVSARTGVLERLPLNWPSSS